VKGISFSHFRLRLFCFNLRWTNWRFCKLHLLYESKFILVSACLYSYKYVIDFSTSCPMRRNENNIYFSAVEIYRSTCLFQKQLQTQFSAPRVDTQQIWKKFCGTGFFYSWHLILKTTVDQRATKQIMFSANLRKVGELWLIRTDQNKCYIHMNSKVFTLLLEKQTVAGKREITEKLMLLIIRYHFQTFSPYSRVKSWVWSRWYRRIFNFQRIHDLPPILLMMMIW
jgi:hypothetical protein